MEQKVCLDLSDAIHLEVVQKERKRKGRRQTACDWVKKKRGKERKGERERETVCRYRSEAVEVQPGNPLMKTEMTLLMEWKKKPGVAIARLWLVSLLSLSFSALEHILSVGEHVDQWMALEICC